MATPPELSKVRRETAERSLMDFAQVYFTPTDSYRGGRILTDPCGRFHYELCAEIELAMMPRGRLVGHAPREHGKSSFGTTIAAIYGALCRGKRHILIIGHNKDEAQRKLRNITLELNTNERLIDDYGEGIRPMKESAGRPVADNDDELILNNGVRIACYPFRSKSIRGQNFMSSRPDLIILDDPEDEETTESAAERKRGEEWINKALLNTLDGDVGSLIWIGTYVHHACLLLKSMRTKAKWRKFERVAYWDYDKDCEDSTRSQALWPERRDVKWLQWKQSDIGTHAFEQEFMGNPLSDDEQVFRPEWWQYYNRDALRRTPSGGYTITDEYGFQRHLTIFHAIDPAFAASDKNDFAALIVLGVDYSQEPSRIYVLMVEQVKMRMAALKQRVIDLYRVWGGKEYGVESGSGQIGFSDGLRESGIPVKEIIHHTNKHGRIKKSSVFAERRQVYLASGEPNTEIFVTHMSEYPRGGSDDLADVYAMGTSLTNAEISHGNSVVRLSSRRPEMRRELSNW